MRLSDERIPRLSDESGAMTITFALMVPVFIAFMALALTAGDWWVHKRHLQTQVDAAALAAAQDFEIPCTSLQSKIEASVEDWGGTRNPQVGEGNQHVVTKSTQENVTFAVNKATYPGQTKADDTPEADPCTSKMIDVKATETGLRGPIGVGVIPKINAHARVEIFQASVMQGLLPIAVPEPAPKQVKAVFVNEDTSPPTELGSVELVKDGTDGSGNPVWDNATAPKSLDIGTASRIGVRIVMSGATSLNCGDPLVSCYDAASSNGLVFINGYSTSGSGAQPAEPKIRSVTLSSTSCGDPSFSLPATTCNVAVHANIDFGSVANPETTGPKAWVRVKGVTVQGNQDLLLHYCATASQCGNNASLVGLWNSTESIPVAPVAGPIPIELEWAETAGTLNNPTRNCLLQGNNGFHNQNPCKGTFGVVQRTFAGSDDRSGPLQLVQVFRGATTTNSLRQCETGNTSCPYDLVVKLSIKGSLKPAQSASEPPIPLRVATDNQTQALDCDPNRTLPQELALGCQPTYGLNSGTSACGHKNDERTYPNPPAWDCVAISTGNRPPQVADGLNERILGDADASTCSNPNIPGFGQNRWTTDFGHWDPRDPRILQLIITPFGSFSGTGTDDTVPVTSFATFYITGWQGNNGHNNPCQDPGQGDDHAEPGFIVGHYITHIQQPDPGDHGSSHCDFTSVTTCVAVLTR
jgi:hypothetical protein